jgi:hypothetical protein
MYYRLDVKLPPGSGYMSQQANEGYMLMDGARVDESELQLPWPFTLRPDRGKELRLADYYSGKNLMSARLVETLRGCGVDSLQTFEAAITNGSTGEHIPGYLVVNVLGLVEAADLAASRARPLADVKHFEKLAIDPNRARGLLMFRLADSRSDVVIDEKVARQVEAGKFAGVVVQPLE